MRNYSKEVKSFDNLWCWLVWASSVLLPASRLAFSVRSVPLCDPSKWHSLVDKILSLYSNFARSTLKPWNCWVNLLNSSLIDSTKWTNVEWSWLVCPLNSSATMLAILFNWSSLRWIVSKEVDYSWCCGGEMGLTGGDSGTALSISSGCLGSPPLLTYWPFSFLYPMRWNVCRL